MDILSRTGIVERASIDECYLDLTQESHIRLAACNGQPPLPVNADRVHICGQVGSCIWPAIQWMTAIPLSLLLTKSVTNIRLEAQCCAGGTVLRSQFTAGLHRLEMLPALTAFTAARFCIPHGKIFMLDCCCLSCVRGARSVSTCNCCRLCQESS